MIDHERFAAGLRLRLEALQLILAENRSSIAFSRKKESVGRDFILKSFYGESQVTRATFRDLEILSFCFSSSPHVEEQRASVEHLIEYASNDYLRFLILGAYSDKPFKLRPDTIPSNIDYSLYVGSGLMSGHIKDAGADLLLRSYNTEVSSLVGLRWPLVSLRSLTPLTSAPRMDASCQSLGQYRELVHAWQQNYWWVFGSDFASTLLLFLNFRDLAEKEREVATAVTDAFGFKSLVQNLEQLGKASYRKAVRAPAPDAERSLIVERLLKRLWNKTRSTALPPGFFKLASALIDELWWLVSQRQFDATYRLLVGLSELDDSLLECLDWPYLARTLPTSCDRPWLLKSFVDYLFLRPTIALSIENYQLKWGSGVFMGSVSWLLDERLRRSQSLVSFFSLMRSDLPPNAASQFAVFLLERSNVERLAPKYAEPTLPTDHQIQRTSRAVQRPSHRRQLTIPAARVQMAAMAAQNGFIDAARHSAIVEEERQIVAVIGFQDNLGSGRVRIPWDLINELALRTLGDLEKRLLEMARHSSLAPTDKEFLRAVCSVPVEHFLEEALVSASWSVDKLISNNLRHGVIVDSYHAAFGNALRGISKATPANVSWGDTYSVNLLGDAFREIDQHLYRRVIQELQTYIANNLMVAEEGSALFKRCSAEAYALAQRIVLSDTPVVEFNFTNNVVYAVRRHVEDFIDQARQTFVSTTSVRIGEIFEKARSTIVKPGAGTSTSQLFDAIGGEFAQTAERIISWIQLPSTTQNYANFQISDLLDLELELIHRRTRSQLGFVAKCTVEGTDSQAAPYNTFMARGEAFEALGEVVHNLVSNAVKHSDLGLKCRLRLEFIRRGVDFEIVATNDLSREGAARAASRFQSAQSAAGGGTAYNAGSDNLSGFQKIREACDRGIGVTPKILIAPPSRLAGYTVRLQFPRASARIVAND